MLRAAARGRDHHPHRLVAFGATPDQLADALDRYLVEPGNAAGTVAGTALREGGVAFVFSGNGAQFPAMGRDAYRASAAFRAGIADLDQLFRPALGWGAGDWLREGIDAERLVRADFAQPLLFAIQVGIVSVLRGIGVRASAHVGHSVGEVAAAWSAGALSLADAVRVIVARSRNQERTRGSGRMAALAAGAQAARELIAEIGSPLEVGARSMRPNRSPFPARPRRSSSCARRRAAAAPPAARSTSTSRFTRRRWTASATVCAPIWRTPGRPRRTNCWCRP